MNENTYLEQNKYEPCLTDSLGSEDVKAEYNVVDGKVCMKIEPFQTVILPIKEEPSDEVLENCTLFPTSLSVSAAGMCEAVLKEELEVKHLIAGRVDVLTGAAESNESLYSGKASSYEEDYISPSYVRYSHFQRARQGLDASEHKFLNENIADNSNYTTAGGHYLNNVSLSQLSQCCKLKGLVSTHSHQKIQSCADCSAKSGDKFTSKTHMVIHTGDSCTVCSVKLGLKNILHKRTSKKLISCTMCSARFTRKPDLYQHMRMHTVERPFSCACCSATFRKKTNLLSHMVTHTLEELFQCPLCSAKFTKKGSLESHVHSHTSEKHFSCPVCSARFTRKPDMYRHMCVHNEAKFFSCTFCSATFSQRRDLTSHMVTHTAEKLYPCTLCSAKFSQRGRLKSHIHAHTCTLCSTKFHMLTGKKRFPCILCSAKFTQKCSLKLHILTHTGEKPFSCKLCTAKFSQNGNLKRHVVSKHS